MAGTTDTARDALASLTESEITTLIYALGCLVEDPGYFQAPHVSADLERIYARMTGTPEGDN